jgi:flagellar hook-associated protein 3 FlgL
MRVTQNMIDRDLMYSLSYNMDRLRRLNEQLSTGKKVNTVSDDVPGARQVMFLKRENAKTDVFLRNLSAVDGVFSVATSTLEHTSETISRIKELAIQAATETYTDENRKTMAAGVDGMLRTLVSLANVQHNDAYVFSGESVQTAPFELALDADGQITAVDYVGEMISTDVSVASGVTEEVNLVGKEIFQGEGDLFETAIALRDAMRNGDIPEITRLIGELEVCHRGIRRSLGELGERQAQLAMLRTATQKLRDLNTQVISDRQDADLSQVSIEYNSHLALLQIVMKVAAESAKPSIANFL